jgi:rhodanese-related sulfurtransferase
MSVTQINAQKAFELLANDKNSVLIDVRTFEEFNFVGFPDSRAFDNRIVFLPWQTFPRMDENPEFAAELEDSLKKKFGDKFYDTKLIFICRTGVRSNQAGNYAVNLGYKNCHNLISGFEGDLNKEEQRGKTNGWKASNLPWRQR